MPVLPTLPDGRFMPGRFSLVIRVVKEYAPSDASWHALVDVEGQEPHATTAPANTVFSPDGLHQARIIPLKKTSEAAAPTFAVIVDGVQDNPVKGSITDLKFSLTGNHYAYLAHGPANHDEVSVFVDGIDFNRPLFGQCKGLHFVAGRSAGNILNILLLSRDGILRLLELRIVAAVPSTRPSTRPSTTTAPTAER